MTDLELAIDVIEYYSTHNDDIDTAEYRMCSAYLKKCEEIEDYKSLLRLVYKQPISAEMVDKVLKKWEEK